MNRAFPDGINRNAHILWTEAGRFSMYGKSWAFLGGVGVGALVMYFLDPTSGNRRRAVTRDKVSKAGRDAGSAIQGKTRDLANRARGLAARTRSRFEGETPADDVLAQRVRTALGRVISHPKLINIAANDGVVTLSGTVAEEETIGLSAAVRAVQGVKELVDETSVREELAR
jgi:hypothetical protein